MIREDKYLSMQKFFVAKQLLRWIKLSLDWFQDKLGFKLDTVAMLLFYFNVVASLVYCVYEYWEGEQISHLTPSSSKLNCNTLKSQ